MNLSDNGGSCGLWPGEPARGWAIRLGDKRGSCVGLQRAGRRRHCPIGGTEGRSRCLGEGALLIWMG